MQCPQLICDVYVEDNNKMKKIDLCEDGILICTHDKLYKWDDKEGKEAVFGGI